MKHLILTDDELDLLAEALIRDDLTCSHQSFEERMPMMKLHLKIRDLRRSNATEYMEVKDGEY